MGALSFSKKKTRSFEKAPHHSLLLKREGSVQEAPPPKRTKQPPDGPLLDLQCQCSVKPYKSNGSDDGTAVGGNEPDPASAHIPALSLVPPSASQAPSPATPVMFHLNTKDKTSDVDSIIKKMHRFIKLDERAMNCRKELERIENGINALGRVAHGLFEMPLSCHAMADKTAGLINHDSLELLVSSAVTFGEEKQAVATFFDKTTSKQLSKKRRFKK